MNTIKEAIDEIQAIKWLIDEGPAHGKLTEAQTRLTDLKSALSTIDPEAIRRETAKYDIASANFEDETITIQIPSDVFKKLGFAPCKISVDLTPLVELGEKRRAAILGAEPAKDDP